MCEITGLDVYIRTSCTKPDKYPVGVFSKNRVFSYHPSYKPCERLNVKCKRTPNGLVIGGVKDHFDTVLRKALYKSKLRLLHFWEVDRNRLSDTWYLFGKTFGYACTLNNPYLLVPNFKPYIGLKYVTLVTNLDKIQVHLSRDVRIIGEPLYYQVFDTPPVQLYSETRRVGELLPSDTRFVLNNRDLDIKITFKGFGKQRSLSYMHQRVYIQIHVAGKKKVSNE